MAAIDDETETSGPTISHEFQKVQLVAIGGQHRIFRRIRRIVIAEMAGNPTDGEDDIVVAVWQAEPCMLTRQSLRNDPVLLSSKGGATARVAARGLIKFVNIEARASLTDPVPHEPQA
ncbi:MAG: hypothetical protein IPJ52_08815 [Rhodocyclaceae bacterium]|nr:hypothetical protein [Rhodocyclaceae bacterium]MBK7814387.1 hypothetical protein [Rhodocyclaceae bacterium]